MHKKQSVIQPRTSIKPSFKNVLNIQQARLPSRSRQKSKSTKKTTSQNKVNCIPNKSPKKILPRSHTQTDIGVKYWNISQQSEIVSAANINQERQLQRQSQKQRQRQRQRQRQKQRQKQKQKKQQIQQSWKNIIKQQQSQFQLINQATKRTQNRQLQYQQVKSQVSRKSERNGTSKSPKKDSNNNNNKNENRQIMRQIVLLKNQAARTQQYLDKQQQQASQMPRNSKAIQKTNSNMNNNIGSSLLHIKNLQKQLDQYLATIKNNQKITQNKYEKQFEQLDSKSRQQQIININNIISQTSLQRFSTKEKVTPGMNNLQNRLKGLQLIFK